MDRKITNPNRERLLEEELEIVKVLGKFKGSQAGEDTLMYAMALEGERVMVQAELNLVYDGLIEARFIGAENDNAMNPDNYELKLIKEGKNAKANRNN